MDKVMNIDLDSYDDEVLARWANTLNGWAWPDDMPGKPDDFDSLPVYIKLGDPQWGKTKTRFDIIGHYMSAIKERIGEKEFLRWHHVNNLKRTNGQFEEWWKRRGNWILTGDEQWLK